MSVDQYFNSFLKDGAPFSLEIFNREVQKFNEINVTPLQETKTADGVLRKRSLT